MRIARTLALALAAACGTSARTDPGVEDVTLEVEPDPVVAGDSVTLLLRNGAAGRVGYNLCTSGLERRTDAGWEPVPSGRVCTMELRTLEPGGVATYALELPAGMPAGEYRYLTNIEKLDTGERTSAPSEPFRVRR